MSLSFVDGKPIARITTGKYKDSIIYLDSNNQASGEHYAKIDLKANILQPIMDPDNRSIWYIAGMAGSGKSTYAAALAKTFHKLHPKKPIYFFSRTSWENDPAYKKIKPKQVKLDESLVRDPILIESDIEQGSLLIFDDIGTIHNKQIKEEVFHLIKDVMEVGRKMNLSLILTSHLILPNEKPFGRVVLNELQNLVIFPHGSSTYHITYVLKVHFGLDKKNIDTILKLPSRSVTITRTYPLAVMYEHGVYLLSNE